jgi:glycosyltransferase involved in cell wall biosynthesis
MKAYKAHRRWIEQAIESVLAQTYPHWHLTIVDDASPDDTASYLREAYGTNRRITLVGLKYNRGPTGAQMEGIRRGSGDAIAFIDSDDRWHPRKLELQVQRLQGEPLVHAVHTDVRHIDEYGSVLPRSADYENGRRARISYDSLAPQQLAAILVTEYSICNGSTLVLRHAYEHAGSYDEGLSGAADFEFWIRFAATGHRVAHLAEPLYDRRIHADRFTRRNRLELTEKRLAGVEKLAATYPELGDLAEQRKAALLREKVIWSLEERAGMRAREGLRELAGLRGMSFKLAGCWVLSWLGPLGPALLRAYAAVEPTHNLRISRL